jgi:hypothetical protein
MNISQWRSSAFPVETKDFNRLDIVTLFRLARTINFIKGKMDAGELEEGIIWKEFCRALEDKNKVKEESITWVNLLSFLLRDKSFFSLRKDPGGDISLVKEKSSKKVLDYFFEKAWQRPILRSRPSMV